MISGDKKRQIIERLKRGEINATEAYGLLKEIPAPSPAPKKGLDTDVAVIGLSCRFPGAMNSLEFWRNLTEGKDAVTEIPSNRWAIDPHDPAFHDGMRFGAFLDDIDRFDAKFFNISPEEAVAMDPQQRLFLQEAWRSLEDAGYPAEALRGVQCGVFAGSGGSDYGILLRQHVKRPEPYSLMGNTGSILPARVSYHLNLKGPAIAVDTACSSSLVAIHLACESIRNKTCDLALAGGVTISTTSTFHSLAGSGGMLAADGRCKTFDRRADGFVPGEGVGVIVLKSLTGAMDDQDHIYGIIKGSAMNHNGKTVGITAPSGPAQSALHQAVYRGFSIDPSTIGYVETHGTGTKMGDPIEIDALTNTFAQYTAKKRFCRVGSVKTNIGHTLSAAGVASVIKALLSLKYRKLPPGLHFEQPNPLIRFEESPFIVNDALIDWDDSLSPRRAAVSAFGFSGTNAHVVLEEAPPPTGGEGEAADRYPVVFSAVSGDALKRQYRDMLYYLQHGGRAPIEDIAYTSCLGRNHFNRRTIVMAVDRDDLHRKLEAMCRDEKPEQPAFTEPDLDLKTFFKGKAGKRTSLPPYPFLGDRYWIELETRHPETGLDDQQIRELIKRLENGDITPGQADSQLEGTL
jgi:acyl transferase domain-containing protein